MKAETIELEKLVKVYFQERDHRTPMLGKFVQLGDHNELLKKGMIRFVNQSRLDYWDGKSIGLTKIYVTRDFSQIRPVNVTTQKQENS